MTDEKRKAILRKIESVVSACENICEDSSQFLQDHAKIVAYERIRNILEGNAGNEKML